MPSALEDLSTEALEEMLRADFEETAPLELDTILQICRILTQRSPAKRDVKEAWQSFLTHYLDNP